MGNKIIGTGHAVPEYVLTNDELSTMVDTNDKWIVERTGMKERRIVTKETTMELNKEAAYKALEAAGTDPQEIELIIVATVTSDCLVPSAAGYLQRDLGIQKSVAFDLNANCSGFLFALWNADCLMRSNGYKKALVVGMDRLSKIVDWTDRSTCVLLGDGAGAVVLSREEEGGILAGHLSSYPDDKNFLFCDDTTKENPFCKHTLTSNFYMSGQDVFKFATLAMLDEVHTVLEKAGKKLEDIAAVVPHQANSRIIDYASKKLGLDREHFFVNVDKYGNTSSASVPIALDEFVRTKPPKTGDLVIAVAFGGGLTSGAVLIEW